MKDRFANPYTDFCFKKIFGQEASKNILTSFLNSLLPEHHQITTLTFKNTEGLADLPEERKSFFDIFCENERGEKFVIELQKAKQNYFRDRTIYYSTFPIREQVEKGEWTYKLNVVYCIGILDFTFTDYAPNELGYGDVIHLIELKDQHNRVFYDKLKYMYLEMPNFKKPLEECHTLKEQWLYFLKNLPDLQEIPLLFKENDVFCDAFQKAEILNFTQQELSLYEQSLKIFRDNKATFDYAMEEAERKGMEKGIAEGLEKGKLEGIMEEKRKIIHNLSQQGFSLDMIMSITELTEQEINSLK